MKGQAYLLQYDDFSSEYDAMFAQLARRTRNDRFVPNADVYVDESGSRVIVHVELAGADPKSLRIEIEDRALFITGRRVSDPHGPMENCLLKEIEYGDFERKIHLPFTVDQEQTNALYHDGILSIELPVIATAHFPLARTEIRLIVKRKTL